MEKFYENIDDYLSGTLAGAERAAFEKSLAEKPELKEELNLYKEIEGSLATDFKYEKEEAEVKKTLQSISKAFFSEEQKQAKVITMQRSLWIRRLAVAAAITLLVVFVWPLVFTSAPPQYADLANHPKASFTEMGGTEDLLPQAEKAFNAGDYAGAIKPLQTYLMDNDGNTQAWFYLGISLLETNETDKAETLFKQIIGLDTAYKIEAIWYLALTALKKGEMDNFKNYLHQIPEGSGHYEKAQKTLKKLK